MDSKTVTAAPGDAGEAHEAESHHVGVSRSAAMLGLCGAVLVLILSLSAFVVGSQDTRLSGSRVGDLAPDFSLRDAAERRVSLRDYEGQPLILLFAGRDMTKLPPDLNEAASALTSAGPDLRVLAVHAEAADRHPTAADATSKPSPLRSCLDELGEQLGRPVVSLCDVEDAVADRYEVTRRPEVVVVSPEGVILDRGPAGETLARLPQALGMAPVVTSVAAR